MKFKSVYVFLVIGLVVAAIFISSRIFLSRADHTSKNEIVSNDKEKPLLKLQEVDANPQTIKKLNFPIYHGDPIDNIGNDPILGQVPAPQLENYKAELRRLAGLLNKDPQNLDGWLRVAVIKKIFNNYLGARDAWEYAKVVVPRNSTAYYNLGILYGEYLKDFRKAEKSYWKAIELDPSSPYLYLGLAEFYSVFYTAKADQAQVVILKGLKVLPNDESLKKALANYQRSPN